ncbi:MAG: PAS domain S-box protein, partial [Flavobacteriales bacterium]|nr:PAS domain S-box protein [Flavobacteriales bacterium]
RSYKRALKNERKYKQIISNIQDIVFKLNEKLEITYLNGAWSKMTDRDIHECIGLPIAQFLESEGAQKLKSRIESLESTGEKSCSVRTAFIKPDGSLYYIRINVKRILKDVRSEYFGTINDIHQGQLNFNLLKESESKFKSLFETVEDVLYSLDADTGRLLIISDKIERFGFKKEQFLEDSEFWTRQIVEEDRAAVQKAYGEFVAQRLPYFEMEYRVQTPSGRIIWIYDRSGIEYDSNKNALRIHGRMSDITEQKNKEIQLEQTENRFRIITENLPFPFILSVEEDFKLIYYNFSFHENFHVRSGERAAFGNTWIEQLVPEEYQEGFEKFLRSNSNFSNHEILLHTKEGLQWYSISSQSIPYKMGTARAIVFYNINKRKLSELELIRMNDVIQAINQTQVDFSMDDEIQDTFYMLLESLIGFTDSSFGFLGEVLYDENGNPYLKSNAISNISWNDEVEEYYQRNFRVGMEFRNLDSLFGWVMVNKETMISNEVEKDPRRSPHATPVGHPTLHRFLGIPIFKGERFVGMVGLANKEKPYTQEDVNFLKPFLSSYANLIASLNVNREKRKAELLQQESESLYRLLSENIDDIVTLHDLGMKTIYASPSLEKVTGFKAEEFIGKDLFEFFNFEPNDESDFTKFPRFVIPIKHGVNGREIKLEMLWKPIYTENGELSSFLAASRDVTDRELVLAELKRTLEKEEELKRLKTKFINMTSHELRTPLATIQSSSDLIDIIAQDTHPKENKEGILKQTKKITEQLRNLSEIVSTTAFFEPSHKNLTPEKKETLNIQHLLIEILSTLHQTKHKEENFKIHLIEKDLTIKTNKYHITNILKNLIENAIKFSQHSKQAPTIKVQKSKNQIVFRIIDFGIGIPELEINQIFEPFFRASNVKNIKGTGLGLSIVKDLVKEIDGEIRVKSKEKIGTEIELIINTR